MRVHLISTWLDTYPILCDSLRLQTHRDWTQHLIHDGPQTIPHDGEWRHDPRITITETPTRYGEWGHPLRALGITQIPDQVDCVVVSNHDNYYVPTFLAEMLAAADGHAGSYCDMIHNHYRYKLLPARLECGHIDCGAVMVRADLARNTAWTSRRFEADWDWIAAVLNKNADFVHVPLPLFVHC